MLVNKVGSQAGTLSLSFLGSWVDFCKQNLLVEMIFQSLVWWKFDYNNKIMLSAVTDVTVLCHYECIFFL